MSSFFCCNPKKIMGYPIGMNGTKTYNYFLSALRHILYEKYNNNMAALARVTDYSHGYIVNILNKVKPAGYDAQSQIALKLGYELFDFLTFGKELIDDSPIRHREKRFLYIPKVYATPSAGNGSFEVSSEVEDLYAFRTDWLACKGDPMNMVLMDVSGDSMSPYIMDGDTVMIDQSKKSLIQNKVYAVRVEDLIYLKYIDREPGKFILRSHNKDYTPVIIDTAFLTDSSFAILGMAIWWGHEESVTPNKVY